MALGRILRQRFKQGTPHFSALSGTTSHTKAQDVTSLAASGRLQTRCHYQNCRSSHRTGVWGTFRPQFAAGTRNAPPLNPEILGGVFQQIRTALPWVNFDIKLNYLLFENVQRQNAISNSFEVGRQYGILLEPTSWWASCSLYSLCYASHLNQVFSTK